VIDLKKADGRFKAIFKKGTVMRKRVCLILSALLVSAISGIVAVSGNPVTQSADLLQTLPDGSGVIVIDLQKVTSSALWSTISAQQKLKGVIDKAQSEISEFGLKLGDMRTMALVFPSTKLSSPIVAINGAFDQKELLDRVRSNTKVKLTSEKYKNFDIYSVKPVPPADAKSSAASTSSGSPTGRADSSFVFRDANTILAGSVEAVRSSIDVITGSKPAIGQNQVLTDALAQSPTAAVKFAVSITPSMTTGLQNSDLPIPDFSTLKLIYGSIEVSSGIDLNATLRSDSDEHAKSIADRLNGLLEMARGYLGAASSNPKSASIVDALKAVTITTANVDVKITGSFPADLLGSLFNPSEKKSR
jgi:hypothetical protein